MFKETEHWHSSLYKARLIPFRAVKPYDGRNLQASKTSRARCPFFSRISFSSKRCATMCSRTVMSCRVPTSPSPWTEVALPSQIDRTHKHRNYRFGMMFRCRNASPSTNMQPSCTLTFPSTQPWIMEWIDCLDCPASWTHQPQPSTTNCTTKTKPNTVTVCHLFLMQELSLALFCPFPHSSVPPTPSYPRFSTSAAMRFATSFTLKVGSVSRSGWRRRKAESCLC